MLALYGRNTTISEVAALAEVSADRSASGISPIEGFVHGGAAATLPRLAVLGAGHVGPLVAAELLKGGPVTWHGNTRPPLYHQDVVPHTEAGPFPVWIGVGGNPQSVIRAARLGFRLALAIIGGQPARFAASSQLFQKALEKFGRPPLPVVVHSPGHLAPTDDQAREEFWPRWRDVISLVAPERGFAIPTEESFAWETGPQGALYVGSQKPSRRRTPPTSARCKPAAST